MVAGRQERGACILGLVLISAFAPTLGLDVPFCTRGLPRLLYDLFAFLRHRVLGLADHRCVSIRTRHK